MAVEKYTTGDAKEIDNQVGVLAPYSWPGFEMLFHDWEKLNGQDLVTARDLSAFTSDFRQIEGLWSVWNASNFSPAQESADPEGYQKSLFEWTLEYKDSDHNPWNEVSATNFLNSFRTVGFDFPTTRSYTPIPIFPGDRSYTSQSASRENWYREFIKYSRLKDMGSLKFRQSVFRGHHNSNNTDYIQNNYKTQDFFEKTMNRDVKTILFDRWADTILNADPYTQMPDMPVGISQRDYAFYELQLARILTGAFFDSDIFKTMELSESEKISPLWIYKNVDIGSEAYIPGAQNAFGSIGGKMQAGVGLTPIIPWTSEYWKMNGDLWRYMRAEYIKIWFESAQQKAFAFWHYKLNGKDWSKAISKTPMLKNSGQPGVGHYGLIYNADGREYNYVERFAQWKAYRDVTEVDFETLKGPPENYERIYADFTDTENFDGAWSSVSANYLNVGSSSAEGAPVTRTYKKLLKGIPDSSPQPLLKDISVSKLPEFGLSCLGTPVGSMYVGTMDARIAKPVTCSDALAQCLTLNAYWAGSEQKTILDSCVRATEGYDTPLKHYTNASAVIDDNADVKDKYFAAFNAEELGVIKAGNTSDYSARPYSGSKFIPSTARQQKRIRLSELQQVGFSQTLSTSRYVNTTTQRTSGGFVIPLTKKLTTIAREAKPLESYDANQEPWAKNLQNLLNLNKTSRTISYTPVKVGSQYYINGVPVSNVTSGKPQGSDSITVPFDDTPSVTGSTGYNPNVPSSNATLEDDVYVPEPLEYAEPFNEIKYNDLQFLDITPLEYGPGGFLVPAGPPARVEFRAPVPSVSVPGNDMIGISPGSELLLNGRKVIFRGNGVVDIATQVNCLRNGIIAETGTTEDGQEEIVLSSCDGMPFNVANGCGAGKYKQVGDFHVNRGFEQRSDNTKSVAKTANATLMYSADILGGRYSVQKGTASSQKPYPQSYLTDELITGPQSPFMSLRADPDPEYDPLDPTNTVSDRLKALFHDYDPAPNTERYVQYIPTQGELKEVGFEKDEAPNLFMPTITETESNVSVYSTGGSGYAIGDRLRLVGGTPVQDPRGPITVICIDSAGAGYTDPANIQIIIDSSDGAGIGAAADVTELDSNGGIAAIRLLNGGFGYDYTQPPEVTVKDYTPRTVVDTVINDAWTSNITLVAGQMAKVTKDVQQFDINGNPTGTKEIFTQFVRCTASSVTLGNSWYGGGSDQTMPLRRNSDGSIGQGGSGAFNNDGGYGNDDDYNFATQGVYWVDPAKEPQIRQSERARIVTTAGVNDTYSLENQLALGKALREESYVEIGHYPVSNDETKILAANISVNQTSHTSATTNNHTLELNNVTGIQVGDLVTNITWNSDERANVAVGAELMNGNMTLWHGYVNSIDEVANTVNVDLDVYHFAYQTPPSVTPPWGGSMDPTLEYLEGDSITFGHKRFTLFWIPKSLNSDGDLDNFGDPIPGTADEVFNDVETYFDPSTNSQDNATNAAHNYSPHSFQIQHQSFTSAENVNAIFPRFTKISIEARERWTFPFVGPQSNRSWFAESVDPNMQKVEAKLTAMIGIDPASLDPDNSGKINTLSPAGEFGPDSKGMDGALRVAKFIVTGVDSTGGITSLKCIDRGLYEIFPSDLTYGIPLEYDYEPVGFSGTLITQNGDNFIEKFFSQKAKVLGIGDPSRNNIFYSDIDDIYNVVQGFSEYIDQDAVAEGSKTGVDVHPEYGQEPFKENNLSNAYATNFKHPNWFNYPEFIFTGFEFLDDSQWEEGKPHKWIKYNGSPGAYDPSTYVVVDTDSVQAQTPTTPREWEKFAEDAFQQGLLLKKEYGLDFDPDSTYITKDTQGNEVEVGNYGKYLRDTVVPGGTGARLFLTSQNVANCNEQSTVKEQLNLPDVVQEINAPADVARRMRNAFSGVGYDPDDITALAEGDGNIVPLVIRTRFPGIRFDPPEGPGDPPIEIPMGDYNVASFCIEGTIDAGGLTEDQATEVYQRKIQEMIDSGQLGVLEAEQIQNLLGPGADDVPEDAVVMSMLCVDVVGKPPISGVNEGDGDPINFTKFPLNDNNSLFGDGSAESWQEVYEYDLQNLQGGNISLSGTANQITPVMVFESKRFNNRNVLPPQEGIIDNPFSLEDKAWIDNYDATTDFALPEMPGFVNGGWVYLENGVPMRWQTELVDTNFIRNAIAYDPETGNKEFDLNLWDPFKGVLPGFMDNEIHFINDNDPVNYNSARTSFGKNQVGKVWWDTSTVKYTWYEQGTLEERQQNWGRAFPGSSITVCEWVESKALPANWNGDGIPRWENRYVTERRLDKNGNYTLMYYYWVMNRTKVDNRVKRDLNRKVDTRTLARYIANPVGYGVKLLTAIANDTLMLANLDKDMDEEVNLQVNISRNKIDEGINHTAWKLLREGDDNSDIPDYLIDKLIDSICGQDALGNIVPAENLSEIERYGIAVRPRQTMFKDLQEARRLLVSKLNEILEDTKLNSEYKNWNAGLSNLNYANTTNYYNVIRVDEETNSKIRYDDSYKPVYKVSSIEEMNRLSDLPDGTVIQVRYKNDLTSKLYIYNAPINEFDLVSIANETIELSNRIYTDPQNTSLALELRALLTALFNNVFANTGKLNEIFFELMKYAYLEQSELSWAFKTSYVYVEKEESDLIEFSGFRPDNFEKVLDYMNEVKPFSTKIREYKDGKRTPIDVIGQNALTDFDKPPYVDSLTNSIRILDDFDSTDSEIMRTHKKYVDYYKQRLQDMSTNPIRKVRTKLVFDRTNWRLTTANWDRTAVTLSESIGQNIANVNLLSNTEISTRTTTTDIANSTIRATDRIFKFDADVRAKFNEEVNSYFNIANASSNSSIIGNATLMTEIVEANRLNGTLALIKDKVGGNFRGEELDGWNFSTVPDDIYYTTEKITEFGYSALPYDDNTNRDTSVIVDSDYGSKTIGTGDLTWDRIVELKEYEGVFKGNATLRRDGNLKEGFDGITFQRVGYGEERPEELALLDPLESLIMTVTTSPHANGNVQHAKVSPSAKEVTYRIHNNLLGGTDYMRIMPKKTATLASNVEINSRQITVTNGKFLVNPTTSTPGMIWIGSERIHYGRKSGNTLSQLTRGVFGTSVENHLANTSVYSAQTIDHFNNLSPESNIWLDTGIIYGDPQNWDEVQAGLDGILGTSDDIFDAWDGLANGNITVSTVDAVVNSANATVAEVELQSAMTLTVGEAVRLTEQANVNNTEVVTVTAINGSNISLVASYRDTLDSTLFTVSSTVDFSSFNYGTQSDDEKWDAAEVLSDVSLSLTDRANVDFNNQYSIMKFLHNL